MSADPSVLDRVRKLLALAGSPNVHEAAAAAARAQELIARHRLEALLEAEAELEADPILDGRDDPLEEARRIRKWKRVLASALAEANGCLAYTHGPRGREALCIAGRAADREMVRTLWEVLLQRIEWLSATAGAGRDRKWHEAFRIGAVETIAERLEAAESTARAELSTTALARLEPSSRARTEALDRFARERLGLGRGRGIRVDVAAYRAGRTAGHELDLPE